MTSQFILLRGQERVGNDLNLDLNRELNLPLKSLSPDQPPGWNDPYRTLEFYIEFKSLRLQAQLFNPASYSDFSSIGLAKLFEKFRRYAVTQCLCHQKVLPCPVVVSFLKVGNPPIEVSQSVLRIYLNGLVVI